MVFDPASLDEDIALVDGLETVTYTVRDLDGAEGTVVTGLPAFREQLLTEASQGEQGWQVIRTRSRFHLKGNQMAAVVPKRGDRITSLTSGTWEVSDPSAPCFGRWFEVSVAAVS